MGNNNQRQQVEIITESSQQLLNVCFGQPATFYMIKEQGKGNRYFRLMYILEEKPTTKQEEKADEETVEYYVGYNVETECMEQRLIDENPCFFYINKWDNLVLKGEDGIDYEIVWDGNLDFADTWPCANVYYEDNSHLEYIHLKPVVKPVGPL